MKSSLFALFFALVVVSSCDSEEPAKTGNSILDFKIGDATGTVADRAVEVIVTGPVDVTTLVPTIEVSPGATVSPASGTPQDFSTPVSYVVKAENGTSKSYEVKVTVINGLESFAVNQSVTDTYSATLDHVKREITVALDFHKVRASQSVSPAVIKLELASGYTSSRASGSAFNLDNPGVIVISTPQNVAREYKIFAKNRSNEIHRIEVESSPLLFMTVNENSYPEYFTGIVGSGILIRTLSTKDVTNILPTKFEYAERSTITPAVNVPLNLSADKKFTVTSETGLAMDYTLRVVKEDLLVENDYPFYSKTISASGSIFSVICQTVSTVTNISIVNVATSAEVSCTFTTVTFGNNVTLNIDPVSAFAAGDYRLKVTLQNGKVIVVKMLIKAS